VRPEKDETPRFTLHKRREQVSYAERCLASEFSGLVPVSPEATECFMFPWNALTRT